MRDDRRIVRRKVEELLGIGEKSNSSSRSYLPYHLHHRLDGGSNGRVERLFDSVHEFCLDWGSGTNSENRRLGDETGVCYDVSEKVTVFGVGDDVLS